MNLENLIKEQAVQLKFSRRNIDIAPDISRELLLKWEKKYSLVLEKDIKDYILVMSYTKTGNFALTGQAMYYDNYLQGGMKIINYNDIVNISAKEGSLFSPDKVYVSLRSGKELCLDGCIDGIDVNKFVCIFAYIVKYAKEHELIVSKQDVPLYELPDELKVLYLKVLCNYAYINDQLIDIDEYNAIGSFSVRMEIGSEARKDLRMYMNNIAQREKTGYLLKEIKNMVSNKSGQWDAFRYSLLQDILYIHNIQDDGRQWTEDGFVGSLMEACSLRPEQMDTMIRAVELNQKIQKKDADLKKLKNEWNQFLAKIRYTNGYVPAMYLFCSGSIYGIENYSGFLRKDDTSEKAINKQRELILHEIIENNQKTMNVLVDDMNYLAERLEEAINKGETLREEYKQLISRVKQAMNSLKSEETDKQKELDEHRKKQDSKNEV